MAARFQIKPLIRSVQRDGRHQVPDAYGEARARAHGGGTARLQEIGAAVARNRVGALRVEAW